MKVVVVDDNAVNVAVLRALVRQLPDCEGVEFTDPLAGLAWCQAHVADLVVVDYMMPVMDGLAFLQAFRGIPGCAEVPVLMVTAGRLSGFVAGLRRGDFRRQDRRRGGVGRVPTTSRQRRLAPEISPALRVEAGIGLTRRCECSPCRRAWLCFAPRLSPIPASTQARHKARQPPGHETEVRHGALNQGVNDFLTKPIDRTEFLARARNMLALRRSQRALADRASWLAEEVAKATAVIASRELDTILRLSRAAEYRDPETGAHVLRMAHYARLIGRRLALPEAELEMLFHAAPMHDVGKVGTPDHILLKPGRLDPAEMAIMREHAAIGYEILRDSPSPCLQLAAVIANSHHEKFDGSGYPAGLAGEAIPLVGRIVAVADVFDALTSERPYKKAWPIEEARAFLEAQAGQHFDPACVQAFLACWDEVLQVRERHRDDPGDKAFQRVIPPTTTPQP